MRSAFFEFNVAISGLYVARSGLENVSHNVANAANPGFSRQYVEQRASTPISLYNGRGMVGTGAEVYGIGQVRSSYLDTKYWHEGSVLGEFSSKRTQLKLTETIFNSLGSTGFTGLFDDYFAAMQDLSTDAGDPTYRTNVIQSAATLATNINSSVEALKKQQSDINAEIKSMVTIINSLGYQIRSLNEQISKFEINGDRANDLRDQRVRLVDQLSIYVNVEVSEEEHNADYAAGKYPNPEDRGKSDKRFTILIDGDEFVNHFQAFPLRVEERVEKLNPYDVQGLYEIYFSGSNKKLDLHKPTLQGDLKGLIDMRDGNNSNYFRTTNTSQITTNKTLQIPKFNIANGLPESSGTVRFTLPGGDVYNVPYTNGKLNADGSLDFTVENLPTDYRISKIEFVGSSGNLLGIDNNAVTEADKVSFVSENVKITDPTLLDINTKGYIEIIDPKTGVKSRLTYIDAKKNLAENSMTIMVPVPPGLPSTTTTSNITVGKTTPYKGIPHYINKLNEMVRTFAKAMNEGKDRVGNDIPDVTGHANGYNQNQENGYLFFTYNSNKTTININGGETLDYDLLTAENFIVNPELLASPEKMATNKTPVVDASENNIVLEFLNIKSYRGLFKEGKISDFIVGMSGELGIDVKQAENFTANYTDVVTSIDNQRIAVSGVDINEEMIMMIKYQQLYQASAKLVNVINGVYDTMINRLGV